MGDPIFVLTTDVVEGWKAEEEAAKRQIAEGQQRLAEIRNKLEAVAVLTGSPVVGTPNLFQHEEPAKADGTDDSANMVEAVLDIIDNTEGPISKKRLRKMLANRGFPVGRLGNYFYTVVHRMKAKGRITVHEDGSIGKAMSS
jgi:hypothetical protein